MIKKTKKPEYEGKIITIFGKTTRKDCEDISCQILTPANLSSPNVPVEFPSIPVNYYIHLDEDYKHSSLERWVNFVKQEGGILVLAKDETAFKVHDLSDVVYKVEHLDRSNLTHLKLFKHGKFFV